MPLLIKYVRRQSQSDIRASSTDTDLVLHGCRRTYTIKKLENFELKFCMKKWYVGHLHEEEKIENINSFQFLSDM
jgi:hypothetical protein